MSVVLDGLSQTDAQTDRPCVVFAYTIKGWRLPTQGHPANHSALLNAEQFEELARELEADADEPWALFSPEAPRGRSARSAPSGSSARPRPNRRRLRFLSSSVAATRDRSQRSRPSAASSRTSPTRPRRWPNAWSRSAPTWPARPTSADGSTAPASGRSVIASTGSPTTPTPWCAGGRPRTGSTSSSGSPRRTWSAYWVSSARPGSVEGEPLLPIGTLYDPFVARALEPWSFGIYAGGQSILVGTPSGLSLAPEGGAHQSIVTPSIGVAQPGVHSLGARLRTGLRMGVPARDGSSRPADGDVELLPALHQGAATGARRSARGWARAGGAPAAGACRRLPPEGVHAERVPESSWPAWVR